MDSINWQPIERMQGGRSRMLLGAEGWAAICTWHPVSKKWLNLETGKWLNLETGEWLIRAPTHFCPVEPPKGEGDG